VQFFFPAASADAWRIRTYGIDHDIHVHQLHGLRGRIGDPEDFARGHVARVYDDVLNRLAVPPLRRSRRCSGRIRACGRNRRACRPARLRNGRWTSCSSSGRIAYTADKSRPDHRPRQPGCACLLGTCL
jgi:hypothetical protein